MTPRLTRLSFVRLLAAAGLLGAYGLAQAQAQAPKEVTLVGFFGLFQDKYTEAVIKPFEQANPDVRVVYRPVRNSAETLALLRLQRANPTVDLAILDVSVAAGANREGLFAPLDPAKVANLADLHPWARPANNLGAAISRDDLAIIYNTKEVKVPPTSWSDLGRPEFKRRLAFPIADTRGVALLPIFTRMAGQDYKAGIEPGIAALKAIAPNVQTWDPQPDVYTAVRSGQAAIAIGWNGRGQLTHDLSGGEVAVAIPKEGSVGQLNTINLVHGAPQADAAQRFVNYALSPEAQARFATAVFYGPTNAKVKLDPALRERIFGKPEVEQRAIELDWNWIADKYAPWVQRIKREVIGG